jgi:peptidoglycan/xylan/chitin deacetylase (PgdA/CDA1 family)
MYHHVSPNPGTVTISPATFEKQMEWFVRNRFVTLRADEFLRFIRRENSVPQKSVLLTFDDGYLDNYVYAFPVLQRLGLHAVIFIVTGWIGDGPVRDRAGAATPNHRVCKTAIAGGRADDVMLRWSEIRRMEETGAVEVHSHTHSHVRWDKKFPKETERLATLQRDLELSRQTFRQQLGRESVHLCWPWGRIEPGYRELAERVGFQAQYTVKKGVNAAGGDPTRVARMVVKDRAGRWFANRLWIYSNRRLGAVYAKLRGK